MLGSPALSRIFIDNEVVWVMDENLIHERRSQNNVKRIKGVIGADFLVEVNAKQNSIPGCEEILCDQISCFIIDLFAVNPRITSLITSPCLKVLFLMQSSTGEC